MLEVKTMYCSASIAAICMGANVKVRPASASHSLDSFANHKETTFSQSRSETRSVHSAPLQHPSPSLLPTRRP